MSAKLTPDYQRAISKLMEETRAFLNGLQIIPRKTSAADATLLALLSKAIVLTEAIVLLASEGYGDEAFALCRTCIEIQLTVRYLTNSDTVQRSNQYFRYFAKANAEWSKLINKYYPGLKLKPRGDAAELEELARKYPDPNKWSKQGEGLKFFAMEADSFERREDGTPFTSGFYYEVLCKWMSYYVHAVEPSTSAHITLPGDFFRVHQGAGTSRLGIHACGTAYISVHLNLARILRYFNMKYPQSLADLFESTTEQFRKSGK